MREKLDITFRKTFQGAWELSAVVDGRYVHHQYFYYTKREAERLFRQHVREVRGKRD